MKVNPAVRPLAMEDYHVPPMGSEPDWLEHGIVAYSPLSNGVDEGNWLACFVPDPKDESVWHITGGSIPFKKDKLRRTAKPIGTMTLSRCDLYSAGHTATRLSIDMKTVSWPTDKTRSINAVGYGVLTGVALRQGHATLCAEACGWAVDERIMGRFRDDPEEGAWIPDDICDMSLHALGYRVSSYFSPRQRAATSHLTLSRDDLLRVPLDQAESRLAGGTSQYIEDGISHTYAQLFPRSRWLPAEVLAS